MLPGLHVFMTVRHIFINYLLLLTCGIHRPSLQVNSPGEHVLIDVRGVLDVTVPSNLKVSHINILDYL